jgi:hypothetical protein
MIIFREPRGIYRTHEPTVLLRKVRVPSIHLDRNPLGEWGKRLLLLDPRQRSGMMQSHPDF